jgi:hypothetical protein
MLLGMLLGCMVVVLGGMQMVPMRHLRVVRGLFVMTSLVVLGCLAVMFGSVLVVLSGLLMVLMNVVTVHNVLTVHRRLPGSSLYGRDEHGRVR